VRENVTISNIADIINVLQENLTRINQGTILIRQMESTPTAYAESKIEGNAYNGDHISIIIEWTKNIWFSCGFPRQLTRNNYYSYDPCSCL
jgi:hypothetical protein